MHRRKHEWKPFQRMLDAGGVMDLDNWVQCRVCGAVLFLPDETTPFQTMEEAMDSQAVKADCSLHVVWDVMRA